MLIDLRTYDIKLGALREFLALYAQEGLAVQTQHLGPPLGYFTTETGELNQVVHLWQYRDMADRQQRRAALEADPRWLAYRARAGAAGQVLRQHVRLLNSVDFDSFSKSG